MLQQRQMSDWPSLRVEDWTDTREALHLFSQVVGKVKLVKTPLINHWWNVTLHVTPRGLSTGSVPDGPRIFQIDFDFVDSLLRIESLDGDRADVALRPMSVADFYGETMAALTRLGIGADINPMPVERPEVVRFDADTAVRDYDREQAYTFWRQLVNAHRVMSEFRARFIGKVSPVHFFWGSFDLAVTRFSGRAAPRHPGGAPHCADWVMVEAYSHEVASCGFWPGGGEEGAFYAYAYPEPTGFSEAPVHPHGAAYNREFGQFLLPYELVRQAEHPESAATEFFQSVYDAAAGLAAWEPSLCAAPQASAISSHRPSGA
jgi:hypothetical protein